MTTLTPSIPIPDNFAFALTFSYDQHSDFPLRASSDSPLWPWQRDVQPASALRLLSDYCSGTDCLSYYSYTRNEAIRARVNQLNSDPDTIAGLSYTTL